MWGELNQAVALTAPCLVKHDVSIVRRLHGHLQKPAVYTYIANLAVTTIASRGPISTGN